MSYADPMFDVTNSVFSEGEKNVSLNDVIYDHVALQILQVSYVLLLE